MNLIAAGIVVLFGFCFWFYTETKRPTMPSEIKEKRETFNKVASKLNDYYGGAFNRSSGQLERVTMELKIHEKHLPYLRVAFLSGTDLETYKSDIETPLDWDQIESTTRDVLRTFMKVSWKSDFYESGKGRTGF